MPRRVLNGVVVSDKGDKTVIVRVIRTVQHPQYKKFVKLAKRYAAHDPENKHHVGDHVQIRECRPMSKNKTWEVLAEGGQ